MDGFTGTEGVIVLARDQPARGPRPGPPAPGPLRPPRGRQPARPRRPPQDPRGAHPLRAAGRRRRPRAAIAATTPGMVGADLRNLVNEAALTGRQARPSDGHGRRLQRRPREDHPRHRAADHALARGARAHRLPRVRPRRARHARAGRRPGAQGVDHPARPGARRDLPEPRVRPLRLRQELPARAHRRRARRPGGRGDRLRRRDHRRRVRPRAGHVDRAPDGRPLGHVRRGRPRVGACRARASRPSRASTATRPPSPRASSSTPRCAASSSSAISGRSARCARTAHRLDSLSKALLEHETLDEADAYAAAGFDRSAAPPPVPAPAG